MWRRLAAAVAVACFAAACGQKPAPETAAAPASAPTPDASASAPAVEPVTPVDYSKPENWLCRPDVKDACEEDASATSIAANGKLTKQSFTPAADPPIDCFYVYPTISRDASPNSDTVAGPEEANVTRAQAARFGTVCKIYAPIYRQVTLPALRQMLAGDKPATNRDMAYADVKAAFERYMAADNKGRGFVLIGHDQGAGILSRLIASEIDGKPVADQMISAILGGTTLEIGAPHDGGGSFKEIGLCVSSEDINCAIAWASFRSDAPPPADSLFGLPRQEGMRAACVNPAELDGSHGQLKAMLATGPVLVSESAPRPPWTTDGAVIDTPFVMLPGMLSAQCVAQGPFNYLAVTITPDPADKRTDVIGGEVISDGKPMPNWGLHLIDMQLVLGNLVDVVKGQSKSYASRAVSRAQHPVDDK
ncbi:MAG TPA: DUF3089 domain-containing protein [Hyphomonadaceae bacterium]|nr:DUF3089 domain-containing protein [Hyphomonadaceae bacterium]